MKLSPKAQASLDKVVEKFKSGDLSPIVEIALLQRKGDPVPFDKWSFSNKIMAFVQSGGCTDLRGYRQWQKAKRQVQKGSRASYILVPRMVKDKDDEEKSKLVGFLTAAVFPYHMTEGDPLPEHDHVPAELPPLMDVAERLGIKVDWAPLPLDRAGSCKVDGSDIRLGTHNVRSWFHELAHAAHAKMVGKLEAKQDARQETVAEICAAVLCELYGHDYTGNSWEYVSALHPDPLKAIMKAMAEVNKVLGVIFENGKEQDVA